MTKTEFMLIGSRQRPSTFTESPRFPISDFQVGLVSTVKSLGVTIDDRLDWSGHIEKVTKKVVGVGHTSDVPEAAFHVTKKLA